MAGDAGESSEDGVPLIPHSWIPSVSDLKLAAGFSEKEKEEEAPLLSSLLYRFCDHDELQRMHVVFALPPHNRHYPCKVHAPAMLTWGRARAGADLGMSNLRRTMRPHTNQCKDARAQRHHTDGHMKLGVRAAV